MSEECFVRAKDLRPGDVIAPGVCVRAVHVAAARVSVTVQERDGPEVTAQCGAETWIQLVEEGP